MTSAKLYCPVGCSTRNVYSSLSDAKLFGWQCGSCHFFGFLPHYTTHAPSTPFSLSCGRDFRRWLSSPHLGTPSSPPMGVPLPKLFFAPPLRVLLHLSLTACSIGGVRGAGSVVVTLRGPPSPTRNTIRGPPCAYSYLCATPGLGCPLGIPFRSVPSACGTGLGRRGNLSLLPHILKTSFYSFFFSLIIHVVSPGSPRSFHTRVYHSLPPLAYALDLVCWGGCDC